MRSQEAGTAQTTDGADTTVGGTRNHDSAAVPSSTPVSTADSAAAPSSTPASAATDTPTAPAAGPDTPDFSGRIVHPRSRLIRFMSHGDQIKWTLAGKALLCGLFSGVLVVIYRGLLAWGTGVASDIYLYLRLHPLYIAPWCLLAVVVGLAVGWMVKKVPMASGSGIPQVKGVLLNGLKLAALPVLAVRYVGGTLCSLFGLSLGREGPSIEIGAAGSQLLGGKLRRTREEGAFLVAGGAAAGLSAAFNAPLSGMMFALEEIYRSFSPLVLLTAAAAGLSADFVSKYWFGLRPVLDFSTVPQMSVFGMLWMIPFGIVVGIIGSLTNRFLLGAQTLYGRLPEWARAPLSMLIAVPVGLFFPYVLGGGEQMIHICESLTMPFGMLALMMLAKMLFTATSFGSGVPGGIFMPILAIGASCGAAFGTGLSLLDQIPVRGITAFAVYGMAAALAACVKSPITAIMLTVEMSGSVMHMLPVAICTFTALFVSDVLHTQPIYSVLLDRYMASHEGGASSRSGTAMMEFPVEPGSLADGARVGSLDMPRSAVLVTIIRGSAEVIPYDSTRLVPGDYLVVVFPTSHTSGVHEGMRRLCQGGGVGGAGGGKIV